ncbi:MAG: Gfo/Idh/MocA family oxidoreductase [Planctomycetaceae bacterium]
MTSSAIRVGIVGAGQNTRVRHLPGLRAIPGVEIVGVANRTPESTAQVAQEWKIPKSYGDWHSLVADPQIDAVVIGTWPNLHCEVTCAALAAGKHVLCEARMARNLSEARQMRDASRKAPNLTAMLVPSPFGLISCLRIQELISESYLGDLREFVLLGGTNQFFDYSQPLHWRQDAAISGENILALGILHETWLRWFPQPQRLIAQTQIFEPIRPNPTASGNLPVTVPDSVQVLAQLSNGARGVYHLSGIQHFGPGYQLHLYGSSGTIKIRFTADEDEVFVGRVGDAELRHLKIPADRRGKWRVEEEFIAAIRGEEAVRHTDFETGIRYMAFTDAVNRSAAAGEYVELTDN